VAFDLPGFGRSEKRNALYSPGQYAAFLQWVVDRCTTGPVTVVGHSLGGAIALHYAAGYPARLHRLVLADVAGILHRAVYTKELLGPKIPDLPGPVDLKGLLGGVLGRLPAPPLDLDFLLGNETLRSGILGGDPAKIAALALVQEDFSPLLEQVTAPTAILWGDDDTVTPLRTGLLLEALLPRARLQVIPRAGHVPMLDQPHLFNRAVLDALDARESAPPPAPDGTSERIGLCRGETGKTFSGPFARIEITDCRDVRLTDITAAAVVIDRSRVVMEQGEIRGKGIALSVTDSSVTATGLRIEGETALLASGSTLDLAGVTLTGTSAAVRTQRPSTLLFSVSRGQSPSTKGYLHGVKKLATNEAL
jgi:pimeloyl-ACP methyl ester carboxylesterase